MKRRLRAARRARAPPAAHPRHRSARGRAGRTPALRPSPTPASPPQLRHKGSPPRPSAPETPRQSLWRPSARAGTQARARRRPPPRAEHLRGPPVPPRRRRERAIGKFSRRRPARSRSYSAMRAAASPSSPPERADERGLDERRFEYLRICDLTRPREEGRSLPCCLVHVPALRMDRSRGHERYYFDLRTALFPVPAHDSLGLPQELVPLPKVVEVREALTPATTSHGASALAAARIRAPPR